MMPRDIAELSAWLSNRDYAILRSVDEHQFLTARQLVALHFTDHGPTSGPRIARRVLERLRDFRLLGTLERRVGGVRAGSGSLVHYLDNVGDQLLHGRSGRHARRFHEPSARFLSHRLAVADAHLSLIDGHRRELFELVDCQVEPASWRRYTGVGAARVVLKSDLYAETAPTHAESEAIHPWFIEIDLGTESLQTLLRKCSEYEAYRRSGVEQERDGGFPIVVWSMSHPDLVKATQRRRALTEAIAGDPRLPSALFRIISPEQLLPLIRNGGMQ